MTTQMVGNASSFRLPMAMSNCSYRGAERGGDVLTMWPRLDAQAARATHKHDSWTPASEPRVSFGFPFPLQCVAAIMQMLLTKGRALPLRSSAFPLSHSRRAHSAAHCNLHLNDPSSASARTEISPGAASSSSALSHHLQKY